jgi:hypothetical protein
MVDFRFFLGELTLAGGLLNMKMVKMGSGFDFGHRFIQKKKESIKKNILEISRVKA